MTIQTPEGCLTRTKSLFHELNFDMRDYFIKESPDYHGDSSKKAIIY